MKITNSIIALTFAASLFCLLEYPKISTAQDSEFIYGGDISILKKMEDSGGVYKYQGKKVDALQLFKENGYNYGRVRIFHTPDMEA